MSILKEGKITKTIFPVDLLRVEVWERVKLKGIDLCFF